MTRCPKGSRRNRKTNKCDKFIRKSKNTRTSKSRKTTRKQQTRKKYTRKSRKTTRTSKSRKNKKLGSDALRTLDITRHYTEATRRPMPVWMANQFRIITADRTEEMGEEWEKRIYSDKKQVYKLIPLKGFHSLPLGGHEFLLFAHIVKGVNKLTLSQAEFDFYMSHCYEDHENKINEGIVGSVIENTEKGPYVTFDCAEGRIIDTYNTKDWGLIFKDGYWNESHFEPIDDESKEEDNLLRLFLVERIPYL